LRPSGALNGDQNGSPDEADLVENLIEFLRESQCVVDRVGPRSITIRSGWPIENEAAGYKLDGYLRVFEALHPGARAERLQ
jgi:hypothetical protein